MFAFAARVTVLGDGKKVATAPIRLWSEAKLVRVMQGRDLSALFPRMFSHPGEKRLEVVGLEGRGVFGDVAFAIHAGEVLGLHGIVGAGRTNVAEALNGPASADTGSIKVDGRAVSVTSPSRALAAGIRPQGVRADRGARRDLGERVHAIVRLKGGAAPDAAGLIAYCATLIAGSKRPRSVAFSSDPPPLSGAGKILKAELRKPFWEGKEKSVN